MSTDVRRGDISALTLTGPAEQIVSTLITGMAAEPVFKALFGPWSGVGDEDARWADYPRDDWSSRELPAISVYEKAPETKSSNNGWLEGAIAIQAVWPASLRRADRARIPRTFSSAILNFFESDNCFNRVLLAVPGLNKIGNEITWVPNLEGVVDTVFVPVTMCEVKYRVDLRQWYRELEAQGRTKNRPFVADLPPFDGFNNEFQGLKDVTNLPTDEKIVIEQTIPPGV